MKTIPLTRGKEAIVDDDFDDPNKWYCDDDGYAVRGRKKSDGPGPHIIRMARVIAERAGWDIEGLEVDHADQNKLNNQLANLRVATRTNNSNNRSKFDSNTSGFKGVSWHKEGKKKKWRAHIKVNDKTITLGYFDSIFDASAAYIEASIKINGDFSPYTADDLLLYRIEKATR